MWSEEDFAWWSKGRKGKKGMSKGNDGYQKGVFRPYQPDKGTGKDYIKNKGKGKFHKGKGKEEAHPQPDFQPLKHLKNKNIAMPGNLMTGLPVSGLMILRLQLLDGIARKLTLLGWRYRL